MERFAMKAMELQKNAGKHMEQFNGSRTVYTINFIKHRIGTIIYNAHIALLDNIPEYKLGYVLAYVQGLTADEDADDTFCQQLYERYQHGPEKDESYTLEECKQE